MILTIDKSEVQLRANNYIPNFRQYLENPQTNLVVGNLPLELTSQDLKELFQEFGKVLSATVMKNDPTSQKNDKKKKERKSNMGFVLFENKADARSARKAAHGKFLGPN